MKERTAAELRTAHPRMRRLTASALVLLIVMLPVLLAFVRIDVEPSAAEIGRVEQAVFAERADVSQSLQMFYGSMVRYQPEQRPPFGDALAWSPATFDWHKNGGDTYDYFVIRSRTDVSAEIFKDKRSSVELVLNADWWWLYEPIDRTR